MKKSLILATILSLLAVIIPSFVFAAGIEIQNPLKYNTLEEIINAIANFIAVVGSGIAVIMIIWGGIVYMTVGSSEEKVKNAKKTIQWALIGLAIVWSAKFLIELLGWVIGKE